MSYPDDLTSIASQVNGARILHRLEALAAIGAEPDGGSTRIAFSREEAQAFDLVAGWLREAGLTVAFDFFGNMFGSTDGNVPDRIVSMAGSHVDTVPHGGRFDGALGIVGAIESILAMQAAGRIPERPLEVVVWRCEEAVRFSQGKVGSLLFTGQITLDELRPVGDPPLDVVHELEREQRQPQRAASRQVVSCLELHIEQGRRLERAGAQIGVVTAVAAPIRLRAEVQGRADHSGATPMSERRDALCAAAELVLAVERVGQEEAAHQSVATTAAVSCLPGVINVIPGDVTLLIDVRGIDAASMKRIVATIKNAAVEIAERRGLEMDLQVMSRGEPTLFREGMIRELQDVVTALGFGSMQLPSGAGHDAQCMAKIADAGMLFVPSVGGVSHSPQEYSRDEDVVTGVRALAACWYAVASRDFTASVS